MLKTRTDINYDGVSGPIGFDKAGDPQTGAYGLYRYAADNSLEAAGFLLVGEK